MSYVNNPEDNRLNIWSNPNKYHNGIPTGNISQANNALWLNNEKQDIANYKIPRLSGTLTKNQTLSGRTFTLSGNLTVPSGKTLKVLSSATIELNGYYVKSTGGTLIIEENGSNNFVKLQSGSAIKALYPTITSAISNAISGQTVLPYGYHTLSSNVLILPGVTIKIEPNATVNLNSKYIKSTGGTIVQESGSTITGLKAYLKNGTTLKGFFPSIATAIENSGYYQTIELLPSTTYSGNISISSKPNRVLKGASNNSSIINGNITVTSSNYTRLEHLKMHNGHTITVNGGTGSDVDYVVMSGGSIHFYNGNLNDLGGASMTSESTTPAFYFYNTSSDVRGIVVHNHDLGIYATDNASLNVSMASEFCNNLLDCYAVSGGYIYAYNNYMSAPWPQSVGGNVAGYSPYTCSQQLSKSSTIKNSDEDIPLTEALNNLNVEYTNLINKISKENEEKTSIVMDKYKSDFDALIVEYKKLLSEKSNEVETTAILSKIEKCYYATESQDEFEAYIKTLLTEKSSPYIERYIVNLNLNKGKYKEAVEVCEKVLSSKEINEALTCEMLYEEALIYKYSLSNTAKANELFTKLVKDYPNNGLVSFAARELEQEGLEIPKAEDGSINQEEVIAKGFTVESYPNPFNPSTTISYSLPSESKVKLVIYDIMGRVMKTLISETQQSGNHQAIWDGTNSNGLRVSSGIYLYRFEALSLENNKHFTKSAKLMLVK